MFTNNNKKKVSIKRIMYVWGSPPVESQLLSEPTTGANSCLVRSCTCIKSKTAFLALCDVARPAALSAGVLHPRPPHLSVCLSGPGSAADSLPLMDRLNVKSELSIPRKLSSPPPLCSLTRTSSSSSSSSQLGFSRWCGPGRVGKISFLLELHL